MEIPAVTGKRALFPPGKVEIRLQPAHRLAYKRLYASYKTVLEGLPVLRDRDFDGRPVKVTPAELEALNRAFASLSAPRRNGARSVFEAQQAAKTRLFKRLQYLS